MRGRCSLFPAKQNDSPWKKCGESHNGGMGSRDFIVLWHHRVTVFSAILLPLLPLQQWAGPNHMTEGAPRAVLISFWEKFGELLLEKWSLLSTLNWSSSCLINVDVPDQLPSPLLLEKDSSLVASPTAV